MGPQNAPGSEDSNAMNLVQPAAAGHSLPPLAAAGAAVRAAPRERSSAASHAPQPQLQPSPLEERYNPYLPAAYQRRAASSLGFVHTDAAGALAPGATAASAGDAAAQPPSEAAGAAPKRRSKSASGFPLESSAWRRRQQRQAPLPAGPLPLPSALQRLPHQPGASVQQAWVSGSLSAAPQPLRSGSLSAGAVRAGVGSRPQAGAAAAATAARPPPDELPAEPPGELRNAAARAALLLRSRAEARVAALHPSARARLSERFSAVDAAVLEVAEAQPGLGPLLRLVGELYRQAADQQAPDLTTDPSLPPAHHAAAGYAGEAAAAAAAGVAEQGGSSEVTIGTSDSSAAAEAAAGAAAGGGPEQQAAQQECGVEEGAPRRPQGQWKVHWQDEAPAGPLQRPSSAGGGGGACGSEGAQQQRREQQREELGEKQQQQRHPGECSSGSLAAEVAHFVGLSSSRCGSTRGTTCTLSDSSELEMDHDDGSSSESEPSGGGGGGEGGEGKEAAAPKPSGRRISLVSDRFRGSSFAHRPASALRATAAGGGVGHAHDGGGSDAGGSEASSAEEQQRRRSVERYSWGCSLASEPWVASPPGVTKLDLSDVEGRIRQERQRRLAAGAALRAAERAKGLKW